MTNDDCQITNEKTMEMTNDDLRISNLNPCFNHSSLDIRNSTFSRFDILHSIQCLHSTLDIRNSTLDSVFTLDILHSKFDIRFSVYTRHSTFEIRHFQGGMIWNLI